MFKWFKRKQINRQTEKAYVVAGKEYIQRVIVLAQLQELVRIIEEIGGEMKTSDVMYHKLLSADRLADFLAVVLIPVGSSVQYKDDKLLAAAFKTEMDIATAMEVISDFLFLTTGSSAFASLMKAVKKAGMLGSLTQKLLRPASRAGTSPRGK